MANKYAAMRRQLEAAKTKTLGMQKLVPKLKAKETKKAIATFRKESDASFEKQRAGVISRLEKAKAKRMKIKKLAPLPKVALPLTERMTTLKTALQKPGRSAKELFTHTLNELVQQRDSFKGLKIRMDVLDHIQNPRVMKARISRMSGNQRANYLQSQQTLKNFLSQKKVKEVLKKFDKWQTVVPRALKIYQKKGVTAAYLKSAYNLAGKSLSDLRVVDEVLKMAEKLAGIKRSR